jgi:2-(1,2-epoxy-1,2-dihydrophenyl)acetyl-CoA isomerase
VGLARAQFFVLLSEVLTAEQALAAGLADQVVPDDGLEAEAMALARRLADGPTQAYGEIKRLFLKAGSAQLDAQLEDEAHTLARIAGTADAQERIAAMLERRKPVFRGA